MRRVASRPSANFPHWTLILLLLSGGFFAGLPQDRAEAQFCENLRNQIEEGGIPFRKTIEGEVLRATVSLPKFYEMNAYQPVWVEETVRTQRVEEMIRAIKGAENEGLDPADYHLAKIEELLKRAPADTGQEACEDLHRLMALEFLLSDAFLLYGSHLVDGRVNPKDVDTDWFAEHRRTNLALVFSEAVNQGKFQSTLESLTPQQPGYAKLKDALKRYRQIAAEGGWKSIPPVKKLQKGDADQRVALIAQRLRVELGEPDAAAKPEGPDLPVFDEALEKAVKRFQRLRGLTEDGVVGGRTFEALNVPVRTCIRRIKINLERWRWLPGDLGERHILVNMADFSAQVVEKGHPVLSTKAIVGMQYRETPVFSNQISYLVLNPYWYVPRKIAVEDKLPLLQKNPYLLTRQKIRVFTKTGLESREINPVYVDWYKVTPDYFPYKLRQDPGPLNALGRVKFMFPNRFNVYLHDTPARELFDKTVRTFSSGCIRIEKARELAEYLLQDDPEWPREKLLVELEKNKEKTVKLKNPIPIHLLYWTAFVDGSGEVHFRNDIYGRDPNLIQAFHQNPMQTLAAPANRSSVAQTL